MLGKSFREIHSVPVVQRLEISVTLFTVIEGGLLPSRRGRPKPNFEFCNRIVSSTISLYKGANARKTTTCDSPRLKIEVHIIAVLRFIREVIGMATLHKLM